jgi:monothiol glutaredoxin
MSDELQTRIEEIVKSNPVVIFMKGNASFPMCGFSNASVNVLKEIGHPFKAIDLIQEHPELREAIKVYSKWPTIPQIYVGGEFVGGCDITIEMHKNGQLKPLIDAAVSA